MAAEKRALTSQISRVPSGLSSDRAELAFGAMVVTLVVSTLAVATVPWIHGHIVAPAIDLALDTIATVVTGLVAVLAWVRFGERRDQSAPYQAAGFFALAVAYGVAVIVSLGRDAVPETLGDPNPAQVYVFLVARILAAALLMVGATTHPPLGVGQARLALGAPAAAVLAVAIIGYTGVWPAHALPFILVPDPARSQLPVITELGGLLQLAIAALFFATAMVYWTLRRLERRIGDAWVAVGLSLAGFAQIQWTLYPSSHPGQVSTGDLLSLAFFVALVLGIEAEARSTMARLRLANVELSKLREADVERVALEERARLARELHDGLAQDLWLAKLKSGQLSSLQNLPPDAISLVAETRSAIDTGLAGARQAVMTLSIAAGEGLSFEALLAQYIEDFEDRFGVRVEFSSDGDTTAVPPRTQAEVLRIAQEALVNVRKHADATMVGVRLTVRDGRIRLRVVDNGRGFDVAGAERASFGLSSMRARASLVGGRLQIVSRPGEGTRVSFTSPLGPVAAPTADAAL